MSKAEQYILMPVRGLSVRGPTGSSKLANFFTSLSVGPKLASVGASRAPKVNLRILDSIHENGAKLVEATAESVAALRAQQPGMRLVPVVYYREARAPRPAVATGPKLAAGGASLKVEVVVTSRGGGSPVADANVVAFTDFANRVGAGGKTT